MPAVARQLVVLLCILAMITVNGLANALPINGQLTGEISNRFDVLFVPAGYVFSIWGLIYLALLAYATFQAMPGCREDARVRSIDAAVVLGCVANGTWIVAWHYERFALSLVLMLTLLASLIAVYLRLDVRRCLAAPVQRWLLELPFSIYLGWITVATVANVSVVLRHYGWGAWGLSDFSWLLIMLGVVLTLAAAMAWTRRDVAYLAVLLWACVGIGVKHEGAPSTAAFAAAGVVALLLLGSAALGRPEVPRTRGTDEAERQAGRVRRNKGPS